MAKVIRAQATRCAEDYQKLAEAVACRLTEFADLPDQQRWLEGVHDYVTHSLEEHFNTKTALPPEEAWKLAFIEVAELYLRLKANTKESVVNGPINLARARSNNEPYYIKPETRTVDPHLFGLNLLIRNASL